MKKEKNPESDFTTNSQVNTNCTANERAKTIQFLEQRRKKNLWETE